MLFSLAEARATPEARLMTKMIKTLTLFIVKTKPPAATRHKKAAPFVDAAGRLQRLVRFPEDQVPVFLLRCEGTEASLTSDLLTISNAFRMASKRSTNSIPCSRNLS